MSVRTCTLLLAGALVAMTACGQSTTPTGPTPAQVQAATPSPSSSVTGIVSIVSGADGVAFSPDSVTISQGAQVNFVNDDLATHVVTADDGSWSSGAIDSEGTSTVTFPNAGTFRFHDAAHPELGGTVVVR